MAGRTVGFAVAFGIPVVLARVLDQHEFGIYKYLFLLVATLGVFQLGMAESLYYFVPRRQESAGRPIANSVVTLAIVGAALAIAMTLGRTTVARWAGNDNIAPYIPPLSLFLAFSLLTTPLEMVMISRKQYRPAAITYALADTAKALLFMVPGVLTNSLLALLWGAVAYGVFRTVALAAYLISEFGSSLQLDWRVWLEQLAYALPFALAVLIETAQLNLHQFVVWAKFDPATFAIYAAGCLQIPLVDLLTTSVGNVMMVRMTEESERRDRALSLWYYAIDRLAFVLWPLVVALVLTSRDLIVFLFTEAYLASVPVFVISSLTIALAVFPVDAVLRVYARTRFLIVMNVIRLAVVAAGIAWAIQTFQLRGAVAITVVGMATAKAVAIWRIAHVLEVPLAGVLPWRSLARTLVLSLAAAVPSWWIGWHLDALPALLHGAVVAITYALAYLALDLAVRHRGRWQILNIRVVR